MPAKSHKFKHKLRGHHEAVYDHEMGSFQRGKTTSKSKKPLSQVTVTIALLFHSNEVATELTI